MSAYFKLAFKNLFSHRLLTLLIIATEAVILFAIGFCIYCDGVGKYGHKLLEQTIYGGVDNAVIVEGRVAMTADDSCRDEDAEMQRELYALPEIHGVGQCFGSGLSADVIDDDDSKELFVACVERQNIANQFSEDIFSDVWFSSYAFGLYNLTLIDEIDLSEVQYNSETDCLFYLGWNYRDIPIGTTWNLCDGTDVIVAGHLKKNSVIFDCSKLTNTGASYNYRILLDNIGILVDSPDAYSGFGYYVYTVEDGYTKEDAMKAVENTFASHGWEVNQYTLSNYEDDLFSGLYEIRECMGEQLPIFIIVSMITFLVLSLLVVIRTTAKYGIYQLVGFKETSILFINLIEHCLQLIPAFLLAAASIYFFVSQIILEYTSSMMLEIWNVLSSEVFGWMSLATLLMLSVSTIFPYLIHRKTSNSKLIKGDWR